MRLADTLKLLESSAPKRYYVIDTQYGDVISEHTNRAEAQHAASARPYSIVATDPSLWNKYTDRAIPNKLEPNKGHV